MVLTLTENLQSNIFLKIYIGESYITLV